MNLVNLNPNTLDQLKTLVDNPAAALPTALKALMPEGPWDLLTQKVSSDMAKASTVELALPLLEKSVDEAGGLGGAWKWTASVEANASLAIDLLAADDLQAMPIRPDGGHTMVAYGGAIGFGGNLGVAADFPAWGKVGIGAGAKRSAALRWYVQAKNDSTLLEALVAARRHFVWPYNLQSMLRMANRTDWFGLELALDGEAQLAIDVAASVQGTGWTFHLNGEKASVGLSFGASVGYKATRPSRWKLSVMVERRGAGGDGDVLGLRVKLHDLRQSSRSASLEVVAAADFSAVATSAERALRAVWPELDSPLLDSLVQPGTAIAGRLRKLIDDNIDGPLKGLVMVLAGGEPPAGLRDGLIDKLTFGLADVLDGALGKLAAAEAKADETVAAWLDRLLGKAAAAVGVDKAITDVVEKALAEALGGLKEAITQAENAIVGKAEAEVDALLERLGELGAQFDKKLDKLDANQASLAIKDAVARYAKLRDKLLGVLTDSQRQRLALTLASEWTRETASEAAFEAWFRPAEEAAPEATRLFDSLCAGRLLALPELVAAATSAGVMEDPRGWLLATRKTLGKERFTLNFFGIELGSSRSWLREVSVKTDLVTGNLLAARAGVVGETAIANPWKERSAKLGVVLELTGGDGEPAALAASLEGAFQATKEQHAKRSTVQDLLDSYADATGAQRTDVRLFLDVPSKESDPKAAKKFWKQLTLAIPVTLSAAQWATFSGRDVGVTEQTALEIGLKLFQRRYASDSLFSKDPIETLRQSTEDFFSLKKASDADVLEYLRRFPASYVGSAFAADEARKVGIPAVSSGGVADRGTRLFLAYHRLSATVQAPLRLRNLALKASERVRSFPPPVDARAVRKALDPIMVQMQLALAPVALASETFLGVGLGTDDEPVSWPFVSFVTTMAKLAGLSVPPGFVPIAQIGDQAGVRLIAAV